MKAKPLAVLFDAMHHGKYEFDDFLSADLTTSIDRLEVKKRQVFKPNKKLKAYHTFLNTFLFQHLEVNPRVVFAYRKGVSLLEAVLAHASHRAFFQTDIVNFFGSIDRELVRESLDKRSANAPIVDLDRYKERILELVTVDGSLPIGFSTSPLISNACLTGFDNDFEAHCADAGLTYTRYADDIVVSAQRREDLAGIDVVLGRLLNQHCATKLALNAAKSKLTSVGRKIKILGMVILPSGQVTIDMALKKRIEVLLHFYVRDREKFLNVVQQDMDSGIDQLGGYVCYVNSVDKPYLEKLKRKFGSTVIDSFLFRSAT